MTSAGAVRYAPSHETSVCWICRFTINFERVVNLVGSTVMLIGKSVVCGV